MDTTAEVVICGAGIAGVAAAYHLTRRDITSIVLVDEGPPLSLTSDKSAESYRNWWPGPGSDMVSLMNRSIDLMEDLARESGNVFLMNRRGYLFATAQPEQVERYLRAAEEAAVLGVGPVRVHRSPGDDYRPAPAAGYEGQPTGTDVITDRTSRSGERPAASTRLRRSRSVTMPTSSRCSTTRMLETPASDMAAAASATDRPGEVVTGSRVTRSPTRVRRPGSRRTCPTT